MYALANRVDYSLSVTLRGDVVQAARRVASEREVDVPSAVRVEPGQLVVLGMLEEDRADQDCRIYRDCPPHAPVLRRETDRAVLGWIQPVRSNTFLIGGVVPAIMDMPARAHSRLAEGLNGPEGDHE